MQQGNRLQESEEKYRLLFERSDDPMMVIYNNRFVLANHAAGRMLNYDHPKELLNVHPASISPEMQPDGKPSIVKANNMMQQAYNEGYHRFEWQYLKKDGERFLAEVSLTRIPYDKDNALFCIWHDVTEWRNAELSLREKTTYLNSVLSASVNVGFIATDKQLNINYYNDIAAQIFGLKAHELKMKNLSFFHEGAADDVIDQQVNMALQQAQDKGEYRFSLKRKNNGKKQYIDARISPIIDDTNHLQGYMLMAEDVTEQHEARKLIEFQATYDYLTNIPNRRTLLEQLTQALSRCVRHEHFGAVLFIDLDNFKNINDTLGHSIGDMLLQQVSQDLAVTIRNEDTVARLGGDEFVILLSETGNSLDTAITNVTQIADKLITSISRAYIIEKNEIRTSISIGITLFPVENESADDILRQADTAMYQAKDAGRNTFRFFSPEMHQKVKQRMKLLDMLHQAIDKNEFQVYFQSQTDKQQQLIGVEALIRWQNPDQGMIFPDQFIPLAEESGLIEAISEFVLRYSVTTQLKWMKEFPTTTIPQISINVSAIQFQKKDFVEKIISVVSEMGGDPNRLTLELTESMLLGNIDSTIKKMQTLQEFGIRFSIDDFGTGYSSLAYLKRLPISEIKIDRSFIQDILTDANDSALVGTILSLARQLNMEVVAEGVENSEIFNALIAKGCHIFQGYYFSKPIPADLFEQKYFKNQHQQNT